MATRDNTINTASGITLIAGIWLIISPFIFNYANLGVSATNEVILGIVIGLLSLIQMTNHRMVWASWINTLAGLWLIISPFVLGYSNVAQVVWNDVILGIIVGALAITAASGSTVEMTS